MNKVELNHFLWFQYSLIKVKPWKKINTWESFVRHGNKRLPSKAWEMKDVDDELTVNSGPYTIPKFLFANSHYSQTPLSRIKAD